MLVRSLTGQLRVAKGWRVIDMAKAEHGLVVKLEPSRATAICSGCDETKTRIHDIKPAREWRHLDAWGVATYIRCELRRVRCRHCGVRVEQVPWARTRSRFTHAFEAEVLSRARDTSIAGVCRQLRLHWTSVMRLIERWVEEAAARQFKRPLRYIGVDEVSYGKGNRANGLVRRDRAGEGRGRVRHTWSRSAAPVDAVVRRGRRGAEPGDVRAHVRAGSVRQARAR